MIPVPWHLLLLIYHHYCSSSNTISQRRPFDDVPEENDDYLFLFKALEYQKEEVFVHSQYRKVFYKILSAAVKRLRDSRITRIALQDPSKSSWRKL